MRDVAALAGVAIKTVSRVMNGEPSVAPELAARVRNAADMLGYRPNLTASSLRRRDRRSATIGLLLEDVSNPFSAALLRSIEDEARERGVELLIGSLDEDSDRERELAQTLIDHQVDGLIMVPASRDQSYLFAERRRGVCVVFLDRMPRLFEADAVVSDNRGGAVAAVEHLLAGGHRRIAFLGDRLGIHTAAERFRGYELTLERAGIAVDQAIVRSDLRTVETAAQATRDLVAQADPPTALFASQNMITIGAVQALHQLGLQHSVALIGFDDFPLADSLEPGVTVITQNTTGLGRLAAERLFARLDGDQSPPGTFALPIQMIERGSGEIPPPDPTRSASQDATVDDPALATR
jgi:LacI family transcriptional regulator